jgi:hypothetical protein
MSTDKPLNTPTLAEMDLHSPQRQLIECQIEHADLDALIDQAATAPGHLDELRLRRMKKRRLALRDQMASLQAQLAPKEPA